MLNGEVRSNMDSPTFTYKIMSNINPRDLALAKIKGQFVFADHVVQALTVGLTCKKNILLYGTGGHAKSQICKAVIDQFYTSDQIFKQQFGIASNLEAILGSMVPETYMKTGKRVYDHSESFMEFPCFVAEEILDAPFKVLEQLKDIMTSGRYCPRKVCYKSRNEVIIGCTNVDPFDWASKGTPSEQSSKKAFLDRFQVIVKVEWENYGEMEYKKLFDTVKPGNGAKLAVLATICSRSVKAGKFISPRTAIHLSDMYMAMGLEGISYSEIPPAVLAEIKADEEQIQKDFAVLERLDKAEVALKQIQAEAAICKDVSKLQDMLLGVQTALKSISTMTAGPGAIKELGKIKTYCMSLEKVISDAVRKYSPTSTQYTIL